LIIIAFLLVLSPYLKYFIFSNYLDLGNRSIPILTLIRCYFG
jgi:hypothetical protein